MEDGPTQPGGARAGERIAAWLFPVLLWLVSTLYLGGRIGKITDDWCFNQRSPVDGSLRNGFDPWLNFHYFWRPLHIAMLSLVGTFAPDSDRGVHVFVAAMHGLACVGLWWFVRRFTRSQVAAAVAAVLFMVVPLHSEVVLWFSTTSTAIGLLLCFGAMALADRFSRVSCGEGGWLKLAALWVVAFAVPCFYEQSAAPLAALPLVCVAAGAGMSRRERVRRAVIATAVAGSACAVYIVLFRLTAPGYMRGAGATVVPVTRLGARFVEVLHGLWNNLLGVRAHEFVLGSATLGWRTVATPAGAVIGSLVAAAGVLWAVWAGRGNRRTSPAHASGWWLAAIGVVVFVAGFLPVYAIQGQRIEPRTLYVPLAGAAMVLGALVDALASRQSARMAVAGVLVPVAMAAAVCMVGFQRLYQLRSREDRREVEALQRLIPDPPPGAMFVPLRTSAAGASTGYRLFDRARHGALDVWWSSTPLVQHGYRRDDIFAAASNPWGPAPYDSADMERVRWLGKKDMPGTDEEGNVWIEWKTAVPIVVEREPRSRVRLVDTIEVEMPDGRDLAVHPPLVVEAVRAKREIAPASYRLTGPEPGPDMIPLAGWTFADGKSVPFKDMWIWTERTARGSVNRGRSAWWIGAGAGSQSEMSLQLPPANLTRRLVWRVTLAPYDLDERRNADPTAQEVVVWRDGHREAPLATLRLDPSAVRNSQTWMPLIVELPPIENPEGTRVTIAARAAVQDAKGAAMPIWITPGYERAIPIGENSGPDLPSRP